MILFPVNSLSAGFAEKQVLLASRLLAEGGYRCVMLAMKRGADNAQGEALTHEAEAAGVAILRPRRCFLKTVRWARDALQIILSHGRLIIWSWGTGLSSCACSSSCFAQAHASWFRWQCAPSGD